MRNTLILGLILGTLGACATVTEETHTAEIHTDHAHVHGDGCGHLKVWHEDHWDYLHDGHLHNVHGDHADEHVIAVSVTNPADEAPIEASAHAGHAHGDRDEDHVMIPHGDHMDYLHDGHLHYVHGDHVDDHGPVTTQENS